MKPLNFFRSVCNWGHILFAIMRVLAIIGAVGTLIGIFALGLAPRSFFTLDTVVQMEMKFNLKAILGDEWAEALEEAEGVVYDDLPEGATLTEDGVEISETVPSTTLENKALALSLVPSFTELLLSFFLYLFLCRVFKMLKFSIDPLCAPVSENLKYAGALLMALGAVPALCGSLVQLLTGANGALVETSFDLWLIFLGFLLWAVADLFRYAAATRPQPVFTENTPAQDFPPQDSPTDGHNPNAF